MRNFVPPAILFFMQPTIIYLKTSKTKCCKKLAGFCKKSSLTLKQPEIKNANKRPKAKVVQSQKKIGFIEIYNYPRSIELCLNALVAGAKISVFSWCSQAGITTKPL